MAEQAVDRQLLEALGRMSRAADRIGGSVAGYAGSSIDARTGVLTVYHAAAEAPFDSAAFAGLVEPRTSIEYRPSLLSAAQADHLDRLIAELRPAFEAAGVRLSGWGRAEDHETQGFAVHYTPPEATLPAELVERLLVHGPDTVTFVPAGVVAIALLRDRPTADR